MPFSFTYGSAPNARRVSGTWESTPRFSGGATRQLSGGRPSRGRATVTIDSLQWRAPWISIRHEGCRRGLPAGAATELTVALGNPIGRRHLQGEGLGVLLERDLRSGWRLPIDACPLAVLRRDIRGRDDRLQAGE